MRKPPPKGKPFPKGTSGNKAGRPKVALEFRAACRDAVDLEVTKAWLAEVKKRGKNWVKCSELLAAYGYGRPSTELKVFGTTAPTVTPEKTVEGEVTARGVLEAATVEKLERALEFLGEPTSDAEH